MTGPAFDHAGWKNGFIIQRNIQNFEKQLTFETDATTRETLLNLIVEQKARLADLRKP